MMELSSRHACHHKEAVEELEGRLEQALKAGRQLKRENQVSEWEKEYACNVGPPCVLRRSHL